MKDGHLKSVEMIEPVHLALTDTQVGLVSPFSTTGAEIVFTRYKVLKSTHGRKLLLLPG